MALNRTEVITEYGWHCSNWQERLEVCKTFYTNLFKLATLLGRVEEEVPSSPVSKVEGPEANKQRKSIRQGLFRRDAAG